MADLDPCALLRQADAAYFDLSSGGSVREVVDQNGEKVSYNAANRAGLLAYMIRLQGLCSDYNAVALGGCVARPLRFLF